MLRKGKHHVSSSSSQAALWMTVRCPGVTAVSSDSFLFLCCAFEPSLSSSFPNNECEEDFCHCFTPVSLCFLSLSCHVPKSRCRPMQVTFRSFVFFTAALIAKILDYMSLGWLWRGHCDSRRALPLATQMTKQFSLQQNKEGSSLFRSKWRAQRA